MFPFTITIPLYFSCTGIFINKRLCFLSCDTKMAFTRIIIIMPFDMLSLFACFNIKNIIISDFLLKISIFILMFKNCITATIIILNFAEFIECFWCIFTKNTFIPCELFFIGFCCNLIPPDFVKSIRGLEER